ncbi:MAG: M48 family metalloprotease [Armatimonadetes bacterium]|nr:M48 family metalloprotease [Armatimonadota bacterium]
MTHTRATSGLLVGAIVLTAFATGCGGATIWSREEEIRVGREASERLEEEYEVSRNPADVALIEGIGQRLVAAGKVDDWPFTFKVLEERSVNAVSLPGGPIYIFRGLIDLTEGDEDELAAVMAHEMAHIQKRHVSKMIAQGVFTNLIIVLATGGAVRTAAQLVAVMAQLRFSRDDEYESDRLAIRYTYRAGYDPNGLVRFFEKLKRLEKEESPDPVTFNLTRTHPLTDARINRAREEIAKVVQEVNAELEAEYLRDK